MNAAFQIHAATVTSVELFKVIWGGTGGKGMEYELNRLGGGGRVGTVKRTFSNCT